jgi:hypothetical protein
MSLTERETWTLIHGMGFGALYLLAFAGGLAGIWSLRPQLVTVEGVSERIARLRWGTIIMAVLLWLTVIVGTFTVYPAYRATPPAAVDLKVQSDALKAYPKFYLLADEKTAGFHDFGMEWKEHVAWISPLLATIVAFAVLRYGKELVNNSRARNMVTAMFVLAFALAGIAGFLGALITKAAPLV